MVNWSRAAAVGVLMLVGVVARAQETGRSCASLKSEEGDTWLARHAAEGQLAAESLPDFLVLPRQTQRYVYSRLSPSGRYGLWRSFYAVQLTIHTDPRKAAALQKVMDTLTPDFFERALLDPAAAQADAEALKSMLAEVFDPSEVRQLVYLDTAGAVAPEAKNLCSCYKMSTDDCQGWPIWSCEDPDPPCDELSRGCGSFWVFPCDGKCCMIFRKCT